MERSRMMKAEGGATAAKEFATPWLPPVAHTLGTGALNHRFRHDFSRVPATLQRKRAKADLADPDPLCASYLFAARKKLILGSIDKLKATPNAEVRLRLIQEIKWVLRCGTDAEKKEIHGSVETGLGAMVAASVWKEAGTPFGGYRASYPGYYDGAKARVKALGVTELNPFDAFAYEPGKRPATYAPSAKAKAASEAPAMTATDLLYFYGHQYARFGAPGAFANGTQTQFVDLLSLAGRGNFGRVKLMVSTSCATICREALAVFAALFPKAVILGYRRSAPAHGDAVRDAFDRAILGLKKPLLLDQPVDVNAIIAVWKSVVKQAHPRENERLPGYYQSGTVHYLENGAWKTIPGADAANACEK